MKWEFIVFLLSNDFLHVFPLLPNSRRDTVSIHVGLMRCPCMSSTFFNKLIDSCHFLDAILCCLHSLLSGKTHNSSKMNLYGPINQYHFNVHQRKKSEI